MLNKKEIEYLSLLNRNQTIIYQVVQVYAQGNEFYTHELYQEIAYTLWREYVAYGQLRYKDPNAEKIYVIRTAVNTIITYYRRYHSKLSTTSIGADILNIEISNESQHLHEELNELILSLSAQDQRMVFYYLEQYPYARIAEIEGMTETAVGTRMGRIFKKLKQISEKQSKN